MATANKKTGFKDPGIMGKPMAKNLIKARDDDRGLIQHYKKKSGVEVKMKNS